MTYKEFFQKAYNSTDIQPYEYQIQLAEKDWPDILDIPTGMGKTAAVVLAWLYMRRIQQNTDTPRLLVYCLPMRVLDEKTMANIEGWLQSHDLYGKPGEGKVSVSVLMGGASDLRQAEWA